jgi:hypothetical protein
MLKQIDFESNDRISSSTTRTYHNLSFPRKRESNKIVMFLDPCFRRDDSAEQLVWLKYFGSTTKKLVINNDFIFKVPWI